MNEKFNTLFFLFLNINYNFPKRQTIFNSLNFFLRKFKYLPLRFYLCKNPLIAKQPHPGRILRAKPERVDDDKGIYDTNKLSLAFFSFLFNINVSP